MKSVMIKKKKKKDSLENMDSWKAMERIAIPCRKGLRCMNAELDLQADPRLPGTREGTSRMVRVTD